MADVRNKTASIYIDDTAAKTALEGLQKKADGLNKSIDETRKKQKALTDEIERAKSAGENYSKQSKELSKLNTELGKSSKALQDNLTKQKALQQQIDSKVGPSLKQQEQLVTKLVNEYKRLGSNSHEAAEKLKEIEAASKSLNVLRGRLAAVQQVQKQTITEGEGGFDKIFGRVLEYTGAYAIISKVSEGLHDLFVGSIDEAMQAEESTARFKATLDNLGKTEVFDRLKQKADELAEKFKYIDNDEIVAVFEKLIDYGKLTEDQIKSITPVIIDFAAKQRIPIEEATDVITKALEGNSKGLKTYGISLKEAATPAERLKIIMTDLKEKVDGAADAFGNTTAGKVAIAKQSYKDLKEEIGTNLLPALNKLLEWVNGAIKGLPLVAQQIKNTLSDTFVFFTQGPGAAQMQKALRLIAQMKQTESDVIQKQVSEFQDKSQEEVHTEIDRINQVIAVKQHYIDVLKKAKYFDPTHFTKEDQKNLSDYEQGIRVLRGTLEGLFKIQDTKTNNVIGTGDPNYDPNEAKRKREEAKREQQKILDDRKKLNEELLKLQHDYEGLLESEYMKELQQAFDKFEKLKELAHGNKDDLQKIEVGFNEAIAAINKKFADKALEDLKKQDAEKQKLREKQLQDQLQKGFQFLQDVSADVSKDADRKNQLRRAEQELEISRSFGKKKYELQQQQLDEEEQLAIEAAKKRGDSVEAVETQFQQKREELARQRWQKEIEMYLGYAQQVLNIVSGFVEARNSKETAALNKQLRANELEKQAYQRMLVNKVISQQQYLAKINQLDIDADKKKEAVEKKQFERNKKRQIAQAIINGIQAELKTLAEFGPPVPPNIEGIIAHAFTIGATIAEIAAIKKTEYTGSSSSSAKFEKGGIPDGPKHKDGGIDMINSKTGKKVGEMEGGEPYMILSGKTYQNNKPVVDALLYNSMHRNGATIDPWFKNRAYKSIDFSGISRSIQNVRHYESGGVFQTAPGKQETATAEPIVVPAMTEQQEALMQAILQVFSRPIKAAVVLQDINDANDTLNAIKADATFGKK